MPDRSESSAVATEVQGLRFVSPRHPHSASRIGVISGSFDPPTNAHLALASRLLEARCGLVLFLYSTRLLPKERTPSGEPEPPLLLPVERLALLKEVAAPRGLAVGTTPFGLLWEQAAAVASFFAESEVWFALGSDKLIQVFDPKWYQDTRVALDRLFRRAIVAYAMRAGDENKVAEIIERHPRYASRLVQVALEAMENVSSREVRKRVAAGEDFSHLVPREVVRAIRSSPSR